ncbi:hypothetical protein T8A63_04385 [Sulfitobacter sp. OXR-159]|jgi:hypothetical protein|uniref:hypothetical protein n=1 Tax=Sulfitobacter sp. OXR-159 TaxID=3100174 RepID=UPI002AC96D0D|nr:hypothetical protein [Sulfitobacter sp. OXR-159]WPZ30304.1 hypothetical protein T8A63_04385 [Sulfitobacter sp. OXR-159]
MSDQNDKVETDAATRADVVAASLAMLVRALYEAGVSQPVAMNCLRNAPDMIEAALTRGAGALIVYRLNPDAPRGIVSDRQVRLEAFTAEARAKNAPLFGLNPHRVARLAAAVRADSCPEPHATPTKY